MEENLNDNYELRNMYFKVLASEKEDVVSGGLEDLRKKEEFENWSKTIKFTPDEIFCPENLDQLKNYVILAKEKNKKIRCASQGHAWSSLSKTNDYLVILDDKLSRIDVEKKNGDWIVNAEAGAQISKIDEYLRQHNPKLTIESMTVLDSVRIGGVVATGSHGANTNARTIAEQVVGLKIVDASGRLCEFSDEKDRVEMAAARVNLGLLGVIYQVSLIVKPMYNLQMKDIYPKLVSFTKKDLKTLVKENSDGIELFYWPFNGSSQSTDCSEDKLWIKLWNKTRSNVSLSPEEIKKLRKFQDNMAKVANKYCYPMLLDNPGKTPEVTYDALVKKIKYIDDAINYRVWEVPDAIHYQAGIESILCQDMEFAIRADDDFGNIIIELRHIVDKMYEYRKQNKFPLNLAVELRILKSSSALLSSAYDDERESCYFFIEVLSYKHSDKGDTHHYKEFFNELAVRWITQYGDRARPHWAKSWEDVPDIKEYLHRSLKERIQKFETVRAKYDPNMMFFDNESLQQIFYGNIDPR